MNGESVSGRVSDCQELGVDTLFRGRNGYYSTSACRKKDLVASNEAQNLVLCS